MVFSQGPVPFLLVKMGRGVLVATRSGEPFSERLRVSQPFPGTPSSTPSSGTPFCSAQICLCRLPPWRAHPSQHPPWFSCCSKSSCRGAPHNLAQGSRLAQRTQCLRGAHTGAFSLQTCREKPSASQAWLCPLLFLPLPHGPQSSSQNTSCCEAALKRSTRGHPWSPEVLCSYRVGEGHLQSVPF